jgi:hypothetical protein
VALARAGVEGGAELLALVFLVIASTVVLAGLSAGPIASLLDQRLPGRDGIAILGAGELALLLGRELREGGRSVVFLDSNPQACRQAEEEGFPVVFGNALQERTLLRARLDSVGTVLGLTPNQMLNGVFVSRTRERFRVPRGYVAVDSLEQGLAPELVERGEAGVLFDGPHEVERWDVRVRHGGALLEHWVFRGAPGKQAAREEAPADAARERFVVLAVRRGARALPMHQGLDLKAGDVASLVVHAEERGQAHAALRALGFEPREEEAGEEEAG